MVLVMILYIVSVALSVHVALREVHRPANALMWVLACMILPIAGYVLYFIMGDRPDRPQGRDRRRGPVNSLSLSMPNDDHNAIVPTLSRSLHFLTGAQVYEGTVRILHNGSEKFPSLLNSLRRASRSIDLEYYIFRSDATGRSVKDALCERGRAGVRVRVLLDGIGCRKFSPDWIREMLASGISVRVFHPLKFPSPPFILNHRDHNKLVIIDGREAFTGGLNVGNEYWDANSKTGHWRDTHLQVFGEQAVLSLQQLFESMFAQGNEVNIGASGRADGEGAKAIERRRLAASRRLAMEAAQPLTPAVKAGQCPARLQLVTTVPGDSVQGVRTLFFLGLALARRTVNIGTPYFVPESDLTTAMKTAVARGVRVRLLTPIKVDHKLVGMASRTYYEELLEAGVEIYLYDAGAFHSKVMTIDDEIAVLGAANCDIRSFRVNYEASVVLYCSAANHTVRAQFEKDLENSQRLTRKALDEDALLQRAADRGARILAPFL